MTDWIRAIHVDECPVGSVAELVIAGSILAICNREGEFHVVDGICLHQGGPLGRGTLRGCHLVCPWHGWQYDVTTGCHSHSQAVRLTRWQTQVRGDEVWIAPLPPSDP